MSVTAMKARTVNLYATRLQAPTSAYKRRCVCPWERAVTWVISRQQGERAHGTACAVAAATARSRRSRPEHGTDDQEGLLYLPSVALREKGRPPLRSEKPRRRDRCLRSARRPQEGVRKWECASGSAQVGVRKWECRKWECASGTAQVGVRKQECARGTAQVGVPQAEVRKQECASGSAASGSAASRSAQVGMPIPFAAAAATRCGVCDE
jgi:hypothetical protein